MAGLMKYNPKKITGSWKGTVNGNPFTVKFEGYMDGEFVTAKYDEARTTKHTGSQGEATVVLNCNKGAKIKVVFSQGSPSNEQLDNLKPDADRNFLPVGQLQFDDLNGTTQIKAAEAWIDTDAEIKFGSQVTGREWSFDTGEAELHVGAAGELQ